MTIRRWESAKKACKSPSGRLKHRPLPILLSGFMFPFLGMPGWAQVVGNVLPLTHFLVLVRGILLKGNGVEMLWPHVWPILLFTAAVLALGLKTFRRTLD